MGKRKGGGCFTLPQDLSFVGRKRRSVFEFCKKLGRHAGPGVRYMKKNGKKMNYNISSHLRLIRFCLRTMRESIMINKNLHQKAYKFCKSCRSVSRNDILAIFVYSVGFGRIVGDLQMN